MLAKRVSILAIAALSGSLTFSLPQAAHAQPAPSASDRETARKLLDDGDAAAQKKDFDAALKAYVAAHAIMNVPTTGIEVAKTQVALGQLVEARDTALEVTRITVAKESSAYAAARKQAQELAESLDGRIPSMRVVITGLAPTDVAEVTIDGATVPAAAVAQPRRVNPGEHHVVVRADGFAEGTADATLAEGGAITDVSVLMKPSKTGRSKPKPTPAPAAAPTAHGVSPFLPAGIVTAGVGLGVGIGAGIVALGNCHKGDGCPAAIASDIGFGVALVGGALTAVGIVFTLRRAPDASGKPVTSLELAPSTGLGHLGFRASF